MVRSTGNNRSLVLSEIQNQQLAEEQTYQAKLRAAAVGSVCEADVTDVVQGIVKRAKEGDKIAIDQLFNQILGTHSRPTHVTNNLVVEDVETAARIAKRANGRQRIEMEP